MVDFFKTILAGATILIQSIGYMVGIKSDLPNINHPSPSPIIISSPVPSNSPNPTPTVSPKINNNQVDNSNSNSQVKEVQGVATHDGTRTGNIIKYKEWCNGNQEISVYENELITKKSSDGKTYTFTQGDWDCYEKSLKDTTEKVPINTYTSPQAQTGQHSDSYCKNEANLSRMKFYEIGSKDIQDRFPELFSYNKAREKYPDRYGSDPNNSIGFDFWVQESKVQKDAYYALLRREEEKVYYKVYNQCLGN